MISVHYSYREGDNKEPSHFSSENATVEHVASIIAEYPWDTEGELPSEEHAGGAVFIEFTNSDKQTALFQLVPIGEGRCMLFVDVILKKGFLGFIGKKAVSRTFDDHSVVEFSKNIKAYCESSISELYGKFS
ncbi:hypothetical protein [Vibrio penaeicida]|uniref:Uncharacterized protein n=1 Tax=Vibrio penaeicida TaxID=104609 RepID=A0AAV5NTB4_9VIBR|nr:hypothetical protein [Vibrio penaeicida]RTZ20937.1 hypothetical protein EKN09_22045 [Vibrio penaeicida]GLQ73956.1 hypothetical protein GCM10007932_33160 [Vibrio penaeicida]